MTNLLAPLVDASDPEEALIAHLQTYLPIWLAELDEKHGLARGYTTAPRSYQVVASIDLSNEPQYPAILIVSPGMSDPPAKEGNGNIRARWEINVAAVVTSKDQESTEKLAKRYAAAISNCVMAKKSLGDPNVRGIDWLGDTYSDGLPANERRTKQLAYVRFVIEYDHVAQDRVVDLPQPPADPTTPLPDYPTLPDIDHVQVDVAKEA